MDTVKFSMTGYDATAPVNLGPALQERVQDIYGYVWRVPAHKIGMGDVRAFADAAGWTFNRTSEQVTLTKGCGRKFVMPLKWRGCFSYVELQWVFKLGYDEIVVHPELVGIGEEPDWSSLTVVHPWLDASTFSVGVGCGHYHTIEYLANVRDGMYVRDDEVKDVVLAWIRELAREYGIEHMVAKDDQTILPDEAVGKLLAYSLVGAAVLEAI